MSKAVHLAKQAGRIEALVGNRLVLLGALLYLTELVVVIAVGAGAVLTASAPAAEVAQAYQDRLGAIGFLAGAMSIVLLGRVLVFVGIRDALARSGHADPLLDWAVAAAAVSVALEIVAHGVAVAGARAAENGAGTDSLVLVNEIGAGAGFGIYGGLGVAVGCSAWVMWRSGLFTVPLPVLGGIAAAGLVLSQLLAGPLPAVAEQLTLAVVLFWVWMLWAGVALWRRRPESSLSADASDPAPGIAP
jgi:hypothetical protein